MAASMIRCSTVASSRSALIESTASTSLRRARGPAYSVIPRILGARLPNGRAGDAADPAVTEALERHDLRAGLPGAERGVVGHGTDGGPLTGLLHEPAGRFDLGPHGVGIKAVGSQLGRGHLQDRPDE